MLRNTYQPVSTIVADRDPETGLSVAELSNLDEQKTQSWYEYFKSFINIPNALRTIQVLNTANDNALATEVAVKYDVPSAAKTGLVLSYLIPAATDLNMLSEQEVKIRKLNQEFIRALSALDINTIIKYSHAKEPSISALLDVTGKAFLEQKDLQKKLSEDMIDFLVAKGSIKITLENQMEIILLQNAIRVPVRVGMKILSLATATAGIVLNITFINQFEAQKEIYGSDKAKDHPPQISDAARAIQYVSSIPLTSLINEVAKRCSDLEQYQFMMMNEIIRKFYIEKKKIHCIPQKIMDFTRHFLDQQSYGANIAVINDHKEAVRTLDRQKNETAQIDLLVNNFNELIVKVESISTTTQVKIAEVKTEVEETKADLGALSKSMLTLYSRLDEALHDSSTASVSTDTVGSQPSRPGSPTI